MRGAPLRPGFFLIGAPKCGTTSLSEYLRAHPQICFADPKEPHFFNTDLPYLRRTFSEREYLSRAFAHQRPEHRIAGEGSVFYLVSRDAVPNILRFDPDARFLVMVRNPIEMAQSLHHQNVYGQLEDEADFETAWRLQEKRRSGDAVPRRCLTPLLLQYHEMARLGSQLARVLEWVEPERLRVIVLDDLIRDPRATYCRVLDFLGVDDDGRRAFPASNERRMQAGWYRRWVGGTPRRVDRAIVGARRALGLREFGLRRRLGEALARPVPRAELAAPFRAELAAAFRGEVELLCDILERDLRGWLAPAPQPVQPVQRGEAREP